MKLILIILLSVFIATFAFADDKAVLKYRNYTPQQIKKLPQTTITDEVPIMYNAAAQRGLSPDSELFFGMQLNSLMYPGIHDYKSAIKKFQTDLSDTPTGILTVWQIHNLEKRSEMQKLSRVIFPYQLSSFMTDNYAVVEGTMVIIDDKIAWPINHVKVKCYKNENYCQLEQISLSAPKDDSWSQSYSLMIHGTETYNISRWNQDMIDAEPVDGAINCRIVNLNLNFKTKEFYQIIRNAAEKCEFMGVILEKLTKPRVAQIIDGSNVINAEFDKIENAAFDVLSGDFKTKVDKVISKEDKK